MIEYLGLHWILMFGITIGMILFGIVLFAVGNETDNLLLILTGMVTMLGANVPFIGFLIGTIVAIGTYLKIGGS